jgi:hypothetical protein
MTRMTNRRRGERILIVGQVLMVVFLGVCVCLHPGLVLKENESGLSNYGVHVRTVIPYSIALLAPGGSCLYVALSGTGLPRVGRLILLVYGVATLAVLLSTYPYLVSHVWHTVHASCGAVLISWEFVTAWWMTLHSHFSPRWLWLAGQSVGTVLALLTLSGQLHVLLVAQVLTGVCWGVVMVGELSTDRLDDRAIRLGRRGSPR